MNRTNEARRARLRYVMAQGSGADERRRQKLRRVEAELAGGDSLDSRAVPLHLLRQAQRSGRDTRALKAMALGRLEVR